MHIAIKILLIAIASVFGLLISYFLLIIISSLFVDTKRIYDRHSRYYRALLNSFTALIVWFLRIRIHTEGLERLEELKDGERFLVVQNHRSKFDPILTWYVLKKYDVAFISKEANMHIPFFGKIIRRCCFMSINREDPREAIRTIDRAAELIKNDCVSMGIYPEGTRNRGEGLLPFHNGVFKIAKKAGAPILVMPVRGTNRIAKNFPKHGTDVYFRLTGIISAENVAAMGTKEIGAEIERQFMDYLEN